MSLRPSRARASLALAILSATAACSDATPYAPTVRHAPSLSTSSISAVALGVPTQFTASPALLALGVPLAWSSSDTTIAQVSASGIVTGVAPGAVFIVTTASPTDVDSIPVTVVTTNLRITKVSVSSARTQLITGDTVTAVGVSTDSGGRVLYGRTLTWSSSAAGVASVTSDGLVRAVGPGTATISAASPNGTTGTVTYTVTGPVASVAVAVAPTSVVLGGTAAASATPRDAQGNVVPNQNISWSTSNTAIASVDPSGVVTGVATGGSTVSAKVGAVTGNVSVTVVGQPNSSALATPATLPQATVSTAMPAVTRTVYVHAGDNLQTALNNAQRGDELVLDAGATFRGNWVLPAKAGTAANGWITIRSSASSQLPAGTRVSPTNKSKMARLMNMGYFPALQTAIGASGWRLIGLELTQDSAYVTWANPGILLLGDGSSAQNTLAKVASDFVIDRLYIHAWPGLQTKRCIALNSARTAIIDSYLSGCASKGQDSQAILGWNGPGPYLIQNNRLEGSGENVMFGSADPYIPGLIPSDITIRGNYFYKQRAWMGSKMTVKNLFELKNGQRVLLEGNVMRNHWVDAQSGYAIVVGSVNQSGGCHWCVSQDLTIRNNQIDSISAGFNLFEGYPGSQLTNRITIQNNLFTNVGASGLGLNGRLYMIQGRFNDLLIENNTGFSTNGYLQFGDPNPVPKLRFTFRNNIGGNAQYNIQSPLANGSAMFSKYNGSSYTVGGNIFVGTIMGTLLPTDTNAPSVASLLFVNPVGTNGNWNFLLGSLYRLAGLGGSVPGVNWSTLSSLIAGIDK